MMRESVSSLKTFFIVVGGLSGYSHFSNARGATGLIFGLLAVGVGLSIAYIVVGLQLEKLLKQRLKLVEMVIIVDIGHAVLLTGWFAWAGLASTTTWVFTAINIGVAVYLLNSTRRLARELT